MIPSSSSIAEIDRGDRGVRRLKGHHRQASADGLEIEGVADDPDPGDRRRQRGAEGLVQGAAGGAEVNIDVDLQAIVALAGEPVALPL